MPAPVLLLASAAAPVVDIDGTIFIQAGIFLLLMALLIVGIGAWRDKAQATAWKYSLNVVVYPINGDDSDVSARYIAGLTPERFDALPSFFSVRQSQIFR